jgi:hypothetical protein
MHDDAAMDTTYEPPRIDRRCAIEGQLAPLSSGLLG